MIYSLNPYCANSRDFLFYIIIKIFLFTVCLLKNKVFTLSHSNTELLIIKKRQ